MVAALACTGEVWQSRSHLDQAVTLYVKGHRILQASLSPASQQSWQRRDVPAYGSIH